MANKRIKGLATTKYKGFMALDDADGTGKYNIEDLFNSIVPEFDPTRTGEDDDLYLAGQVVMYQGKSWMFLLDHYGAWIGSDVVAVDIGSGIVNPKILELKDIKLDVTRGKNLFNKDAANKRANAYAAYASGVLFSVAGTTAYVIPVEGGTVLSFNKPSLNVAAYSTIPSLVDSKINHKLPGYLGGTASVLGTPWTVPAGAACIVVSVGDSIADSTQVEIGSTSTQYEAYKVGVPLTSVFGLVDSLAKKLDIDHSKNLFNKDVADKRSGVYVTYNAGYISSLTGYSAYVVYLPEGAEQVSINKIGAHVCAFSDIPDLTTASGTIPGYLGGCTGASNQGFSLPEGTKCLVVSWQDATVDELQVELGASSTSYTPYAVGLDYNKLINVPKGNELHVGVSQKYTTIQAAVNAAEDYDTIVVHPGEYDEAVDVVSRNKFITIKGTSRDLCILKHSNGNYQTPPLEMGKGRVENLTIYAYGHTLDEGAIDGAYCVHIDYNIEINQSLTFEDCKFISEWRPCVGIGLRENFTLRFLSCAFEANGAACVYCHEQQADNKKGQRIEIVNCSLYQGYSVEPRYVVALQETSAYTGNEANILMQRNIMKNAYGNFDAGHPAVIAYVYGGGTLSGDGYLNSNIWELDTMSEMNTESIANASSQS